MRKLSFVIPSAPDRDHTQILNNFKQLHRETFQDKYIFEIFLIKGTWPSAQRNIGIEKATGELIFFFDDDIIITEQSITSPLKHFENSSIQVVGGPNLTPPQNTFLQHCFGYVLSTPFTFASNACRYKATGKTREVDENKIISCNAVLCPKAAKAHPFNEKMFHNEETEWFGRIKQNGGKIIYDPIFFIYHHRRPTVLKFFRQIFNWGHGRGEHLIIQPKHLDLSFLVPTFFVLYLAIISFYHPLFALIPLATYLVLNIFFSVKIAYENKSPKSLLMSPWLMTAVHILYGIALPIGLLRRLLKPRHVPHYNTEDFQIIKTELS